MSECFARSWLGRLTRVLLSSPPGVRVKQPCFSLRPEICLSVSGLTFWECVCVFFFWGGRRGCYVTRLQAPKLLAPSRPIVGFPLSLLLRVHSVFFFFFFFFCPSLVLWGLLHCWFTACRAPTSVSGTRVCKLGREGLIFRRVECEHVTGQEGCQRIGGLWIKHPPPPKWCFEWVPSGLRGFECASSHFPGSDWTAPAQTLGWTPSRGQPFASSQGCRPGSAQVHGLGPGRARGVGTLGGVRMLLALPQFPAGGGVPHHPQDSEPCQCGSSCGRPVQYLPRK